MWETTQQSDASSKKHKQKLEDMRQVKKFLDPKIPMGDGGGGGGGGVFTLAVEMPLSVTGTTYQWFVS